VDAKDWGKYLRRNIVVVVARIATGELQVDTLEREHILGLDIARVGD
jgi:hypothetical protein